MKTKIDSLKRTYRKWKAEQEPKAREFYADPFTNELTEENIIPYKHKFLIGGSTDAAILGRSKWATKQSVYEDMLKFELNADKFVFDRGHALEEFVAQQFTKQTHIPHTDGGVAASEEFEWSYCQIDKFCNDKHHTPLEIKTAGFTKSSDGESEWGRGCEFNDKGDCLFEDSKIPDEYYIQCQKQMWLTDTKYMYLCAWILTDVRVRTYIIHRNDEVIEQIKEAEIDFLFNHVIPQVPYENEVIDELESVDEAPDVAYGDDSFLDLCKQYKLYSKQKLDAEKQQKALDEQIRAIMGEHHQVIKSDGSVVAKLTEQERLTLDSKGLSNKYPEQYKEFYRSVPIKSKLTISKEI